MRVGEVMTRRVRTVREADSIELATAVLRFWSFRHLPVLDAEGHPVGMLTPTDVLDAALRAPRPHRVPVVELMRQPVETVREDERVEAAAERMRSKRVHAFPVVGPGGRLVGIVTDVDLLAALVRRERPPRPRSRAPVDAVMTARPVTIDRDATLADAAEALLQGAFRHLPVVDGQGRLVGMLSERDVRSHLGVDLQGFLDATLEALSEPVAEAMTPDPIALRSGTPIDEAVETFARERVGALPVVDEDDRLLGILSYVDVLRSLHAAAR